MAERYTRLYTLPENLYVEGAPLVIAAGALLKDNQTGRVLSQLKFRSISDRRIKAVKVTVTGYGMGQEVLCREEHQYLDLDVGRDELWGSKEAITLPNRTVRTYTVAVPAVYFCDGGSYLGDETAWEPMAELQPLDKMLWNAELLQQYRIETTPESCFVPASYKDLWVCACGEINHEGEICHRCHQSLDRLEELLDVEYLRERKNERLALESQRSEAVDAVREMNRNTLKKVLRYALPAAVVLALGIGFWTVSSRRVKNYEAAAAMMEKGEYKQAAQSFEALGGYNDSAKLAEDAKELYKADLEYASGQKLIDEKKYDEARDALLAIENKPEAAELADEALYLKAASLLEEGQTDEAREAYIALGDYKDAKELSESFVIRKLKEHCSHNKDCGGPLTTEFGYDEGGILRFENQLFSAYPGSKDRKFEYSYGEDGSYTMSDGLVDYHYDKQGNYLGQGGLELYEYDYGFRDDGSMSYCDAYTIEEQAYIYEYRYDEKGNAVYYHCSDGTEDSFVNEYEGELLIKQDRFSADGSLIGCKKYEYDKDGRITKLTALDESGDSVVTEYVYGYVFVAGDEE